MLSHLVWDLVCHPSLTWFENGLTRQKPGLTHVLHMFFVRIFKSSSCKLCDDDDDEVWRSNKITDWGNIEISKSWVLSHSCTLWMVHCTLHSSSTFFSLNPLCTGCISTCCLNWSCPLTLFLQWWHSFKYRDCSQTMEGQFELKLFCILSTKLKENSINYMINLTHCFPVCCADSCPNFQNVKNVHFSPLLGLVA